MTPNSALSLCHSRDTCSRAVLIDTDLSKCAPLIVGEARDHEKASPPGMKGMSEAVFHSAAAEVVFESKLVTRRFPMWP